MKKHSTTTRTKPLKILAVYDNGGSTLDRYSVYYNSVETVRGMKKLYLCLSMSDNPAFPLGICQHSVGQLGKHNGKKIAFKDLPKECQRLAITVRE